MELLRDILNLNSSVIANSVKKPGRRITGSFLVQSIIVDSMPISQVPPSMIKSNSFKLSPNSSSTSLALVGDTAPNLFALGAAIPFPPNSSNFLKSSIATGCEGIRNPTLF